MCIYAVATNFHDDFDFLLLFNRDEFYARPSSPPKAVFLENNILYCPLDQQSGGTWMGFNVQTGKVVALTNVRAMNPPNENKKSRGELVLNVLCQDENDNVFEDAYYNYHLMQTNVQNKDSLSMKLVTCAPPHYTPKEVEYNIDKEQQQQVPWVATKSNDDGTGLTTAQANGENRWPKAVWLRNEVERILMDSNHKSDGGQEGAQALVQELESVMSATDIADEPLRQLAASVIPSVYNPLLRKQERVLAKAPFVTPFYLYEDDKESLYGTVSQSALLYSRSEQCLYYAHRDVKQQAQQDDASNLPSWTWERIPIQENTSA